MGKRDRNRGPAAWIAGVALLLSSAGCEPLRALSLFESAPSARNVPFTADGMLTLDVYVPAQSDGRPPPWPVIVFFYGGAWQKGAKESYQFVGSQLAERGFVTVLPDYRLYPDVRFPAFVEDAAAAVSWAFENVSEFGGDPQRVFVMGHSAGAHIASLVHYDERYLDHAGAARAPCGFVGLSGPYDFLPLVSPELQGIFPAPVRDDSQPVRFVDGTEGPALLVHGMKDDTVEPRNPASLAEAVATAGGEARVELYENRGHVDVLLSLWRPLWFLSPTIDTVTDFAQHQACAPQRLAATDHSPTDVPVDLPILQ